MTKIRSLIDSAQAGLPAENLLRWASIFFSLSVLTFLISIAASQTFLALAGISYGIHLVRGRVVPHFPPIKLPLTFFCLFSTLPIFWAENRSVGWFVVRKLVLFLILLLAVNLILSAAHLTMLFRGLFLESALVGIIGAAQFARIYLTERALHPHEVYSHMTGDRVTGLMGHWMNFGGQQMLVFVCLTAFLLLAPGAGKNDAGQRPALQQRAIDAVRDTAWRVPMMWWPVALAVAVSIVLNFTRGVWVGTFVACVYLVARWRARWLWALPALVIAGYIVAPGLLRQRFDSVRHPSADPSLAIRFEMWQVGGRMIQRHPLVGVGPGNIPESYALYLPAGQRPRLGYRDHLHNNFIQIGAERGLPCLAAWLWLMVAMAWRILKIRKQLAGSGGSCSSAWVADAALASWLALIAEGCFEFNFGASPVLMVFLFVLSAPFVSQKDLGFRI